MQKTRVKTKARTEKGKREEASQAARAKAAKPVKGSKVAPKKGAAKAGVKEHMKKNPLGALSKKVKSAKKKSG